MTEAGALKAYLDRIGLTDAPPATAEGLVTLQRAHRLAIPFENLDIMLGRGVDVSPGAVFDKLVGQRRGGYCFEQNGLFLRMLAALGFEARPLLARVWLGIAAGDVPPRTHMLALVKVPGGQWIADVGFGGSMVPPLPLADGAGVAMPDGTRHLLRRAAMPGDPSGQWLLERDGPAAATDGRAEGAGWVPQYGFSLEGIAPADIAAANHWTATAPGTRFTSLHVVSRVLPDGFAALSDRQLTLYSEGRAESWPVADASAYRALLDESFGIALPAEDVGRLPLFAP